MAGKGVCKQSALGGELVEIRRRGRGVTVTTQLRTDIFATDPDDVWAFGGRDWTYNEDQDQCCQVKVQSHRAWTLFSQERSQWVADDI